MQEDLNVKILVKGSEQEPLEIVAELFSDRDYFFVYKHCCDIIQFADQKEGQGLKPDFPEYLTMLVKLFTYAIDKPESFKCALNIHADNSASLLFQ